MAIDSTYLNKVLISLWTCFIGTGYFSSSKVYLWGNLVDSRESLYLPQISGLSNKFTLGLFAVCTSDLVLGSVKVILPMLLLCFGQTTMY